MGLFENSHFPYTNFHEMNMDKLVEIVEDSAGKAGEVTNRVTTVENKVTVLEGRADTTDGEISDINGDINSINSSLNTVNSQISSLDTRTTQSEGDINVLENVTGGLQDRMTTAENDIDNLESTVGNLGTRMTTAEDNIDDLQSDVAEKTRTLVTQGSLTGGVLVGTVTVDGVATRLYAPTAGSTVVRAEDVPFNNSDVIPPMQAIEVQEAIEELNTNNANTATRMTTAENNITALTSDIVSATSDIESLSDRMDSVETINLTQTNDIRTNYRSIRDIESKIRSSYYYNGDNPTIDETDFIEVGSLVTGGYITGSGRDIYFTIPWDKVWVHNTTNPIDDPNNFTIRFNAGMITIRGNNGYIVNNQTIEEGVQTSFTLVTLRAQPCGLYVRTQLPTSAAQTSINNTPVGIYLSSCQVEVTCISV